MSEDIRIDKFLWCVRIFKTRSDAAEACKTGKVLVNNAEAKSSKVLKPGDRIMVRKGAIHYEYIVNALIDKRQGAALVKDYITDITPQTELDKLVAPKETFFLKRERGQGRPTKKQRREIDSLLESLDQ